MREYFPYWQEILAAVFFVWLVLITVSFYLGRSAMKKELGRISALIDESGKNFKISRMELYNVISAIERRVAGIEDRELENSTEYSNVLAEVTALVQKGSDSAKHTFYFRVAEEVVKLQTNLNHMDPQIKGYRQLLKCSERLKDAMLAEGYEFIDISLHDDGSIEIFYVDFEDYAATWDFKDYNEARQWLTSEDGEGLGEMLFDYESK